MPVTVNRRLKFEIEIVHDLSCHPTVILHDTCIKNANELIGVVSIDRDVREPVQFKQLHEHTTSLLQNLASVVVT